MSAWEFRVLGPLEGARDGAPLALSAGKQRTILAALLLRGGPVSVQELIEAVWEDPPEGAREAVRAYVMRLRRACGVGGPGELIRTADNAYWIDGEAHGSDLRRFEELREQAAELRRRGASAEVSRVLGAATSLWRFPLLENVPSAALHQFQVPLLRERYLSAVQERVEVDLGLGRQEEVLPLLRELVVREPLREAFWFQLMVALDAVGGRAEAISRYQGLRASLVEELGVEPDAKLRALYQRLLQEDRPAGSGGGSVGVSSGSAGSVGGGRSPAAVGGAAGRGDGVRSPGAAVAPVSPGPVAVPVVDGGGDAVVPASAAAPPVPRQLPLSAGRFVGRSALVAGLDALRASGGAGLVAVTGPAGVGKTSLAVHLGRRWAAEFPDGQLYVDLHGHSPAQSPSAGSVLARLLASLGVAARDVPEGVAERAALLRSVVAGRRVLLVVDDAAGRGQVEPLLLGGPGCVTLVTSRDDLRGLAVSHGAVQVGVEVLEAGEAEELLHEMVAGPGGAAAGAGLAVELGRLARACGFLPLALRVAGANLAGRSVERVAEYVAEVESGEGLGALRVAGAEELSVRGALERSYAGLPGSARRMVRLLGAVGGVEVTSGSAAALAGVGAEGAAEALDLLVRGHLVERSRAGRFGMHDLVRRFARAVAVEWGSAAERAGAVDGLLRYYLAGLRAVSAVVRPDVVLVPAVAGIPVSGPVFAGRDAAVAWFDAEWDAVAALVEAEGADPSLVWRVVESLRGLVGARLRTGESARVFEVGLAGARDSGELLGVAAVRHARGAERMYRQDFVGAMADLRVALAGYRRCGWAAGRFAVHNTMGAVLAEGGRYREGVGCFERALAGWRSLGVVAAQEVNLGNLGEAYFQSGDAAAAVAFAGESLRLSGPGGASGFSAVPRLVCVGSAQFLLGNLGAAREALEEALAAAGRLGLRLAAAEAWCRLSEVDAAVGRLGAAAAGARRALELTRDAPDSRERVLALVVGARWAGGAGLGEAVRLSAGAGVRHLRCAALVEVSSVLRGRGDGAGAVERAGEVVATARECGMSVLVGRGLRARALGWSVAGEVALACADAEEAVEVHRAAGHRVDAAWALRVLGAVESAGGVPGARRRVVWARQVFAGVGLWWPGV